jgi:hypothetical protein
LLASLSSLTMLLRSTSLSTRYLVGMMWL